jgi:GTP-dependent phosphoenolpyruvate carboxykinase
MRGGPGAGIEPVAVADDSVAEDWDAPMGMVVDDIVFGDVATEEPPIVRIARSPPVGFVPLYGSAKTV